MRIKSIYFIALLLVLSFCSEVFAGQPLPPLKRRGPVPYKSKWVSSVKKGKLFQYKRKEFSSPRILDKTIFVGGASGYFHAFKKKTGRKIWRFKAEGPIYGTATFGKLEEKDIVLFGDNKGIFYALWTDNGEEVWRKPLGSEIAAAPTVQGDRVYITTLEGKLSVLKIGDGSEIWSNEKPHQDNKMTISGHSSPVINEKLNRVYVGYADGTLTSFSTISGKVDWEAKLGGGGSFFDIDGGVLLDPPYLYVSTFDKGFYAIEEKSGKIFWKQEIGSAVRPLISETLICVSGSDGHLYSIQKKGGMILWKTFIGKGTLTAPVIHRDVIAVGLSDKTMNFVNARTGKIIASRFARKGIFSDPIIDEDRIYYLSNGGKLYSLKFVK